jgi:hypothetical protein
MAITISGDSPSFASTYQGGVVTSGTNQASTSGTAITFTGIPSWVKRITLMLNGVSLSGTSNLQIQVGSGSVTSTGYVGGFMLVNSGGSGVSNTATTGALLDNQSAAVDLCYSNITITNITGNTWVIAGTKSTSALRNGCFCYSIALSGTLDRVQVTTVNGTDTFDAGSINILYE